MGTDYIGTYNGSVFYPMNEDTKDVNIEAIAYALSNNVRFCGHTSKPWTVAQHSLLVARFIREELKDSIENAGLNLDKAELYGLLHDASEAYLSDICRPIKQFLPDYANYEKIVQNKILSSFGLDDVDKYMPFVKIADDTVLYAEATILMNPNNQWKLDYADGFSLNSREKYERYISVVNRQIIEAQLINRCYEICKVLNIAESPIAKIDRPKKLENGYIPLYQFGKAEYIVSIEEAKYIIKDITGINEKCYTYSKNTVDNTLDIFKLIEDGENT